jgi:FkbM family methyltransferase
MNPKNNKKYKFIDKYLFFDHNLLSDSPVFVEVGNRGGKHPNALSKLYPDSTVIVYEASPLNFPELQTAVSGSDIIVHNKAVTDIDGEVKFHEVAASPSSSSVLKRKGNLTTCLVPSITPHTILEENRLNGIDVLFLNCEGSELKILDWLAKYSDVFDRIEQVCISYHPQIYGRFIMNESIKKMCALRPNITSRELYPCTLLWRKS